MSDILHWPPPPHDPRERELTMRLGAWEVRVFVGRKFQYFVGRGFWHVQLWNPSVRISILTPSRLTSGLYETFPIDEWKRRASDYDSIALLVAEAHGVTVPSKAEVLRIEKALVDDVVRFDVRLVS